MISGVGARRNRLHPATTNSRSVGALCASADIFAIAASGGKLRGDRLPHARPLPAGIGRSNVWVGHPRDPTTWADDRGPVPGTPSIIFISFRESKAGDRHATVEIVLLRPF